MVVPPRYTEGVERGAVFDVTWLASLFNLTPHTVQHYQFIRWTLRGSLEVEMSFMNEDTAQQWIWRSWNMEIHMERLPLEPISKADRQQDLHQTVEILRKRGWVVDVPPSEKDVRVYFLPHEGLRTKRREDPVILKGYYKGRATPEGE